MKIVNSLKILPATGAAGAPNPGIKAISPETTCWSGAGRAPKAGAAAAAGAANKSDFFHFSFSFENQKA